MTQLSEVRFLDFAKTEPSALRGVCRSNAGPSSHRTGAGPTSEVIEDDAVPTKDFTEERSDRSRRKDRPGQANGSIEVQYFQVYFL